MIQITFTTCIVIAAITDALHPPTSLPLTMRFVLEVKGHCSWVSDHQLLDIGDVVSYQGSKAQYRPTIVDIYTKKKTRPSVIWRFPSPQMVHWFPSPSGEYILFREKEKASYWYWVLVSTIDGKRYELPPSVSPASQVAWMADDRHWAALTKNNDRDFLLLYALEDPIPKVRVDVSAFGGQYKPSLCCITTRGEAILWYASSEGSHMFARIDLHKKRRIVGTFSAKMPEIDAPALYRFSPDGEHIAWVVYNTTENPPGLALLPESSEIKRLPASYSIVIYISRRDGSELKLLGHVKRYKPLDRISRFNVFWSPHGDSLGVLVEDAFYLLSLKPRR